MADTRVQIIADLEAWALDEMTLKVRWVNGLGSGKTSIAHTFSERLDMQQMLGADVSRALEHLPTFADEHLLHWFECLGHRWYQARTTTQSESGMRQQVRWSAVDNMVLIWNVNTGAIEGVLEGDSSYVPFVAFSKWGTRGFCLIGQIGSDLGRHR